MKLENREKVIWMEVSFSILNFGVFSFFSVPFNVVSVHRAVKHTQKAKS